MVVMIRQASGYLTRARDVIVQFQVQSVRSASAPLDQ